jgi:hypothetical protein
VYVLYVERQQTSLTQKRGFPPIFEIKGHLVLLFGVQSHGNGVHAALRMQWTTLLYLLPYVYSRLYSNTLLLHLHTLHVCIH